MLSEARLGEIIDCPVKSFEIIIGPWFKEPVKSSFSFSIKLKRILEVKSCIMVVSIVELR